MAVPLPSIPRAVFRHAYADDNFIRVAFVSPNSISNPTCGFLCIRPVEFQTAIDEVLADFNSVLVGTKFHLVQVGGGLLPSVSAARKLVPHPHIIVSWGDGLGQTRGQTILTVAPDGILRGQQTGEVDYIAVTLNVGTIRYGGLASQGIAGDKVNIANCTLNHELMHALGASHNYTTESSAVRPNKCELQLSTYDRRFLQRYYALGAAAVHGFDAGPTDSDGDGVPADSDYCDTDPAAAIRRYRNAPDDQDLDGLTGSCDKCPQIPSPIVLGAALGQFDGTNAGSAFKGNEWYAAFWDEDTPPLYLDATEFACDSEPVSECYRPSLAIVGDDNEYNGGAKPGRVPHVRIARWRELLGEAGNPSNPIMNELGLVFRFDREHSADKGALYTNRPAADFSVPVQPNGYPMAWRNNMLKMPYTALFACPNAQDYVLRGKFSVAFVVESTGNEESTGSYELSFAAGLPVPSGAFTAKVTAYTVLPVNDQGGLTPDDLNERVVIATAMIDHDNPHAEFSANIRKVQYYSTRAGAIISKVLDAREIPIFFDIMFSRETPGTQHLDVALWDVRTELIQCGPGSINTLTDVDHCGECGNSCNLTPDDNAGCRNGLCFPHAAECPQGEMPYDCDFHPDDIPSGTNCECYPCEPIAAVDVCSFSQNDFNCQDGPAGEGLYGGGLSPPCIIANEPPPPAVGTPRAVHPIAYAFYQDRISGQYVQDSVLSDGTRALVQTFDSPWCGPPVYVGQPTSQSHLIAMPRAEKILGLPFATVRTFDQHGRTQALARWPFGGKLSPFAVTVAACASAATDPVLILGSDLGIFGTSKVLTTNLFGDEINQDPEIPGINKPYAIACSAEGMGSYSDLALVADGTSKLGTINTGIYNPYNLEINLNAAALPSNLARRQVASASRYGIPRYVLTSNPILGSTATITSLDSDLATVGSFEIESGEKDAHAVAVDISGQPRLLHSSSNGGSRYLALTDPQGVRIWTVDIPASDTVYLLEQVWR